MSKDSNLISGIELFGGTCGCEVYEANNFVTDSVGLTCISLTSLPMMIGVSEGLGRVIVPLCTVQSCGRGQSVILFVAHGSAETSVVGKRDSNVEGLSW